MSRSSMTALITRVRLLVNDPAGASQIFSDDEIQDVLDDSRIDVVNEALVPTVTYTSSATQYLNYYSKRGGGWESDYSIKQNLTTTVTPSSVELIAGKFTFSSSTDPAIFITGKLYDVYAAAADVLEMLSARSVQRFAFASDGQSFQPQQVFANVEKLTRLYRSKQRPRTITLMRSDMANARSGVIGPKSIDYIASGDH